MLKFGVVRFGAGRRFIRKASPAQAFVQNGAAESGLGEIGSGIHPIGGVDTGDDNSAVERISSAAA